MRVPPSDPHDCVWLLAVSLAPVVLRYEERHGTRPTENFLPDSFSMEPALAGPASRGPERIPAALSP